MIRGRIVLSGGGDSKTSFSLDERYFSLLKNNSKILYIPVALERDRVGFEACYDWFSSVVSSHSGKREIDFTMLLENQDIPEFEEFDSIYVGGGNTYKLLDYVYKSNIDTKLIKYIREGGIFYGGSAGAIILGKDIRTVEEENNSSYSRFDGLNLLGNKSVVCHYTKTMDPGIFKIVERIGSDIIALPENSGIILSGEKLETVGEVFVFDKVAKRLVNPFLV